jgi:hypothetical protein
MVYSKAKLKNIGDKKKAWFQTIPNRKHVRQMLAYPESVIDFIQTHVYEPYEFHGDTKPREILYKTSLRTES